MLRPVFSGLQFGYRGAERTLWFANREQVGRLWFAIGRTSVAPQA